MNNSTNTNNRHNNHSASNAKTYITRDDAKALARRMKGGKVLKSEVGAISHGSVVFLRELTSCLKGIIESDRHAYSRHMDVMEKELDALLDILRDGKVTGEERSQVFSIISDVNHIMERSEAARKAQHTTMFLAVTAALGVGTTIFLGGRNSKNGHWPKVKG